MFRSETEQALQFVESLFGRWLGMREWPGGSCSSEVAGQILSDAPTFGCDFDGFAFIIVKIDENTWTKLAGTGCDAA